LKKNTRRFIGFILFLTAIGFTLAYTVFFTKNTNSLSDGEYFYIRHDDTYAEVRSGLIKYNIIKQIKTFDLAANKMNLPQTFKPGRYKIDEDLTNTELIRKIRNGQWDNVVIKIDIEMSRDQIIQHLAENLEASKTELLEQMKGSWVQENGFTEEDKWTVFLADHYHFNWASDSKTIIDRFISEYKNFWNKERLSVAKSLGLRSSQVCVLASIVDAEAIHIKEMPIIAGLYLNRLNRGMMLQADPTILYVVGKEGRKRVLNKDLKTPHPYNTYLNKGLPPGPVFTPDKRAILAVLDSESHNYIYMCAKPDASYYHNFTASLTQHQRNARAYQQSLNKKGVLR